MWTQIGGIAGILAIGVGAFKFLNGRVTHCEDKNSEVLTKVFDKLDAQNREVGEVKAGMKGMEGSLVRIERKINNGR